MKLINSTLLFLLASTLPHTTVIPQGDPYGWHEEGAYLSHLSDYKFYENGLKLIGMGISEEDYEGFGHFVSVTTTLSGGGNNRVVTDIAGGKFFVAAEASFVYSDGDEGDYDIDSNHEWYCPYVGNGYNEFSSTYATLSTSFAKYAFGFSAGAGYYFSCPQWTEEAKCDLMLVSSSQLPMGVNPWPDFLKLRTLNIDYLCLIIHSELASSCSNP